MIVVTTKIYSVDKSETKQTTRNRYLWANMLIIDDNDEKCPVIEG
jgi:hypothetical protein